MQDKSDLLAALGDELPLIADGRRHRPTRREVSARWLFGTLLTGFTSSVLMGVALLAALDGRQQLATPPEIANPANYSRDEEIGTLAKAPRLVPPLQIAMAKDRQRMEVSMVTRVGDRDLIRSVPFVRIKMALAATHTTGRSYPPFDPLQVFGNENADQAKPARSVGQIYGAKVESEMSLKIVDFPLDATAFDVKNDLSDDEVEMVVRHTRTELGDSATQVAALHYVNPQRFGGHQAQSPASSYGAKIIMENASVTLSDDEETAGQAPVFAEEIIPFANDRKITDVLANSGYTGADADNIAEAITKLLSAPALQAASVLRVGLEIRGNVSKIVRTSVYGATRHIATIALDDDGQYVSAKEPDSALLTTFDDSPPVVVRSALPNVYDGIYRAAFSYGMSMKMTQKLIKLFASDVDLQSRLSPSDRIEVLFSQPDVRDQPSSQSQILYVSATFGGVTRRRYNFQTRNGTSDYFDEEGRSGGQFLIRNPVPNGRFGSGFGLRRHPILGYVKMHTGTDWKAPAGTPILAAGDGIIEKAGRAGGYGNQTIIRHANGYETSYNHQKAFAEGIEAGARVRQGQVIGYVGSTGLSTGPHLHFEMIVNGTKVDPMRVRLPASNVLKGEELIAFQSERARVDELLKRQQSDTLNVASVGSVDCGTIC
jgi:murein DD-endopeptidase MepM/ murein hydrolase activator NlpD